VPEDRKALCQALEAWMAASAQRATGFASVVSSQSVDAKPQDGADCDPADCTPAVIADAGPQPVARNRSHGIADFGPPSFPAGF